jgi:hypothetical protein
MRTIKSFGMFIGESVTNYDLQNNLINPINEGEVIPGVQLNPSQIDFSKLRNKFFVELADDSVKFVGLQKDSKPGSEEYVTLTFLKEPLELPDGIGKTSAFMSYQPLTKTGSEGATKYLRDYTVKGSDKLNTSATATNLLGGFLFSSGANLSNLLNAMTHLRFGKPKPQAKDNPTFVSFFSGLVDALNNRNAFTKMKEPDLQRFLKITGDQFRTALEKSLDDYKKTQG